MSYRSKCCCRRGHARQFNLRYAETKNNNKKMSTATRQSNIELLRIFCMLGVITGHALQNLYDLHTTDFSVVNTIQVLLMNACVTAVNCFVMISGYFHIKASWKGIVNLWTQLFFYALISFMLYIWLEPEQSLLTGLKRIIFPLSESGLWFIVTYFALYLVSPLLNKAIENQTRKEKNSTLIMLLVVDIYLGYMHQSKEITVDGYHLIHFIILYYLGSWISEYKSSISCIKWGRVFLLLMAANTVLHAVKMVFPSIAVIYSMRYNAPMTLLSSICFFFWALTWRIQSGFVNKVAKSVLSVYIISELVPGVYYNTLHYIQINTSPILELIIIPLYIIVFFCCCISFDQIRIKIQNLITPSIMAITSKISSVVSGRIVK